MDDDDLWPSVCTLGDQRPSELYYKMKNLADSVVGGAVPTNVVFNRWVNKLPTN